MAESQPSRTTVSNERLPLTAAERAAVDALEERDRAAYADLDAVRAVERLRHGLRDLTRDAVTAALPDLEERRRRVTLPAEELDRIKGLGPVPVRHARPASDLGALLGERPSLSGGVVAGLTGTVGDLLGGDGPVYVPPTQPAGAGELWWAETSGWTNVPEGTLFVDVQGDPCRIWGHFGYGGDPLHVSDLGVSMVFACTPDRLPRTSRTRFEVRPNPRLGGWVSGWTGQYHPIWHADDKWAKVWRTLTVDLTTSTGQWLAGDAQTTTPVFLENAEPVGQANASQVEGWAPILTFDADLAALRAQQVSILLRFTVRYDLQLEGESDLWFRNRPGSATESVAAFDNAVTVRMLGAGVITAV